MNDGELLRVAKVCHLPCAITASAIAQAIEMPLTPSSEFRKR